MSELGTMPPSGAVTLHNSLDRDLGLGSLERVEPLFRLEQAFRIRFADRVMGEADALLDLAQAIVAAEPPVVERYAPVDVPAAGTAVPSSARTLVDVLLWHLAAEPDRPHIFLHRDDGTEQVITPAALWQRAVAVAAGLRDRGVRPGHSVALMLRTEEAFFAAFCGVLLLGAVPVPLYPPFRPSRLEEYALRQVGILKNAEARLLVTFPDAERMATIFRARARSSDSRGASARMASGQRRCVPCTASRRLLASIPMPIRFVAKRELKDTALIGTIIRKVGHLTVERFDISRSAADAETVSRALRREASLLFFPEGTFRAAPGLLPFRLGAFKAAVEAGRPVIPIAILGTRDILPADQWILHRGPITVAVGTPIASEGGGWREIVRLRDRARAAIATRLGEGRPDEATPEYHGEESRTWR